MDTWAHAANDDKNRMRAPVVVIQCEPRARSNSLTASKPPSWLSPVTMQRWVTAIASASEKRQGLMNGSFLSCFRKSSKDVCGSAEAKNVAVAITRDLIDGSIGGMSWAVPNGRHGMNGGASLLRVDVCGAGGWSVVVVVVGVVVGEVTL